MTSVVIKGVEYGIRIVIRDDGTRGVELFEADDPDAVASTTCNEFMLINIDANIDTDSTILSSRWLGDNKLDISNLFPYGSRLNQAKQMVVKKEGDSYVFIIDAEFTPEAIDKILIESGFSDPLEAPEELREAITEAFMKETYFYSSTDTRKPYVYIGGIKFYITELAGGEVRLTTDQANVIGGVSHAPKQIAIKKVNGEYVFYGNTGLNSAVTQDEDDTVVFSNYVRYSIKQDPVTGQVSITQMYRDVSDLGTATIIELDGEMFTIEDLGAGAYSFSNGTYTYTSDPETMTVRLGEMLNTSADMYQRGVDAGVMFLMDPPNMEDYSIEMYRRIDVQLPLFLIMVEVGGLIGWIIVRD